MGNTTATKTAKTSLSDANNQITTAAKGAGALVVVLDMAAHGVANQGLPTVNIVGLEQVGDHLKSAQDHANAWLNTYRKEVLNTLQGVVTFGEMFSHLYTPLHTAAQNMADEKEFKKDEIASLISQIKALQAVLQPQKNASAKVYGDITIYSKDVNTDYTNFDTDYKTADAKLGGDTGEIAQLQRKIDSENDALTKDALMIAGGSVGMVAGIVCIVAGALGAAETGGGTVALVVVGVALLAGGAAVTGVGGSDYDKKLDALSNDMTKLQNEKSELSVLKTLKLGFTNLKTQVSQTEAALKTLSDSWQQLDNGLGAVVTDLQTPETYLETLRQTDPNATPATVSAVVTAELETANDDWTSSLSIAKTLLANLRGTVALTSDKLPTQANIKAAYDGHAMAA